MARSVHVAVKEAVDAAVSAGHITQAERGTLKQFSVIKGDVDADGFQRYYLNAQFNEFFEIPAGSVVAEVDLAGNDSPLVLVLIRGNTDIKHHRILRKSDREVKLSDTRAASFLAGDIAARHLDRSRIAAYLKAQLQDVESLTSCEPSTIDGF